MSLKEGGQGLRDHVWTSVPLRGPGRGRRGMRPQTPKGIETSKKPRKLQVRRPEETHAETHRDQAAERQRDSREPQGRSEQVYEAGGQGAGGYKGWKGKKLSTETLLQPQCPSKVRGTTTSPVSAAWALSPAGGALGSATQDRSAKP